MPECTLCNAPIKSGQVVAGVRVGHEEAPNADGIMVLVKPGEYFEGHYDCVVEALGPVKALEAIQNSKLPPRDIAMAMAARPTGIRKEG